MAIDAFLDFKKSPTQDPTVATQFGESIDAMFTHTFHVKTFTFSITQKGTAATGTGLGAGKAEFEDFEFTIDTQLGSPKLMLHCAKGTCFDTVILHVRKAGGGQVEYLQYVFGNCILSSYSTSGDEESTDTVKFNYRQIAARYLPQGTGPKDEGKVNPNVKSEGSYDLKSNTPWEDGLHSMVMETEPKSKPAVS
jgi:type VI secretion system secreted protein Hcp